MSRSDWIWTWMVIFIVVPTPVWVALVAVPFFVMLLVVGSFLPDLPLDPPPPATVVAERVEPPQYLPPPVQVQQIPPPYKLRKQGQGNVPPSPFSSFKDPPPRPVPPPVYSSVPGMPGIRRPPGEPHKNIFPDEPAAEPAKEDTRPPLRLWRAASGNFQARARLVAIKAETVVIENEDGKLIELKIADLSDLDQRFVNRTKRQVKE